MADMVNVARKLRFNPSTGLNDRWAPLADSLKRGSFGPVVSHFDVLFGTIT